MRPTPPKLKSLARNEVKAFLDDYKEYSSSHDDVDIKSLLESGLLEFLKYSKNATTDEHILCELKEFVSPSSASGFDKEFSKVVFDANETDGVQKITKLFSDFEIALGRTNLAPPVSGAEREYVLGEEGQCKILIEKLPEDFKKSFKREERYRVVDTKRKLYDLLCKLAKDWNWSTAKHASEKESNEISSSTGTTTMSILEGTRLTEQAKQSRRTSSRVNQILGRE